MKRVTGDLSKTQHYYYLGTDLKFTKSTSRLDLAASYLRAKYRHGVEIYLRVWKHESIDNSIYTSTISQNFRHAWGERSNRTDASTVHIRPHSTISDRPRRPAEFNCFRFIYVGKSSTNNVGIRSSSGIPGHWPPSAFRVQPYPQALPHAHLRSQ